MSDKPSAAYLEIEAKRAALGDQLFELMVKENWYATFALCFREFAPYEPHESGAPPYIFHGEPHFEGEYGRHFLGGQELLRDAREHKARALGERLDDDRLKELIEEVLHEELEKHGVVLQWRTRHFWDGSDRVLEMYHTSEKIPPAT